MSPLIAVNKSRVSSTKTKLSAKVSSPHVLHSKTVFGFALRLCLRQFVRAKQCQTLSCFEDALPSFCLIVWPSSLGVSVLFSYLFNYIIHKISTFWQKDFTRWAQEVVEQTLTVYDQYKRFYLRGPLLPADLDIHGSSFSGCELQYLRKYT